MTLDLPPISRSAPQGAHTAKSNLVRPSAAHRSRKRRGGRAAGLGRRFDPSPRPSLRGKGARGHESAAAGNRCGGTGVSPIVPPSSTGSPPFLFANRMRSAYKGVSAASRIHHSRTGGGAGDGRGDARGAGRGGCRGRGPPCGPPGKPQGAQGPRAATRASPPLGLGPSTLDKLPSVW